MRSIERHLLVWILGALCCGALVLVVVSYFVALSEMDEILDENLKQVALSVASHELDGVEVAADRDAGTGNASVPGMEGLDFAILSWTRDGRLLFASDPRLTLPFETVDGWSRVRANGEAWQVFTVRRGDTAVQAAQRVAAREFEAAEVAAKLVPLLVILVVLIGLLLIAALRRGLAPLRRTATQVGELTVLSLEPIAYEKMPVELHSMIQAINRLMQRLSETFTVQRRFVADAAHELRTPIAALKLQAQLLERVQDVEDRAEAMSELKAGIRRSEHLIAQLLALSRLEPGAWRHENTEVDIGKLVRNVVVQMSATADLKSIDLGAEGGEGITLQADPEQLAVLLGYLVQNALRHTPRGGVVSVRAWRSGSTVTLSVVDNGPGIPETERARVFDRFYRGLHESSARPPEGGLGEPPGSGLGLSIVKAIADRHQASVALHTAAGGRGLEVRVTFNVNATSPKPGRTVALPA